MSKRKPASAARIRAADIQSVARQGVARALAARNGITDLPPDQLENVTGGAKPTILEKVKSGPILDGYVDRDPPWKDIETTA